MDWAELIRACAHAHQLGEGDERKVAAGRAFKKLVRAASDEYGYDKQLLEKAARWVAEELGSRSAETADLTYRMLELTLCTGLDLDLAELLHTAAAQRLSDKRIAEYDLLPVTPMGAKVARRQVVETLEPAGEHTYYKSGCDAVAGYLLRWKGRAQAIVAFGPTSPDEVMVYQMQGILGRVYVSDEARADLVRYIKTRGLAPLPGWQNMLIEIVERVALAIPGVTSLGIQSGKNNWWAVNRYFEDGEGIDPHLSPEGAYRAYDIPAERAAFTLGADGNWHRPVTKQEDD